MSTDDPEIPGDRIEATFALLTAARKLEHVSKFWLATEKYVHAHTLLTLLAKEKRAEAEAMVNTGSDTELETTRQVAKLYASQADEYWKKSRACLIKAMEEESTLESCDSLDDDQALARNRSFAALFSKPVEEAVEAPLSEEPIEDADDLESRLTALNQSLPAGFKTVSERMQDVNAGLGKLGVSSVYTKPQTNRFEDEMEKDEDEQIEEILAQAKDEVMMDNMGKEGGDTPNTTTITSSKKIVDDDDGSILDDSETDDSDGDELLDNDQMGMKTIHKKVVKAQAKLAELLSLVDKARTKRAKEDVDEEEEIYKNNGHADDSSDEDSFQEVQKHDVAFLMMTGKKKLRSAQRDLKKALGEWEDLIL